MTDRQVSHENRRPARPPRRKRRRRGFFPLLIALVLILIVVLGGVSVFRDLTVPANAKDTQVVSVEIPSGTSIAQMGVILEDKGLIRSHRAFKHYVKAKGVAEKIQAGTHQLSPSMTLEEVVSSLQANAGEIGVSKIAVNEGLTIDQIAGVVEKQTKYSKKEFLALMKDETFLKGLVKDYPFLKETVASKEVRYALEGYLFPATYEFNDANSLESLVTMMLDKTATVLEKYQSEIDKSEHSINEIMTLASLIEKEGVKTSDRQKISGVFYNRLKKNMPIQSDISVLYALNTHKEMVTLKDLEVDSPYNLYTNPGLSPGPMNNPGEDAIMAAIEPDNNDYLYFFANLKTGKVYFTADYKQHLAWQKEYEETGEVSGK